MNISRFVSSGQNSLIAASVLIIGVACIPDDKPRPSSQAGDRTNVAEPKLVIMTPVDKLTVAKDSEIEIEGRIDLPEGAIAPEVVVVKLTDEKAQHGSVALKLGDDGEFGAYKLEENGNALRVTSKLRAPNAPGNYSLHLLGIRAVQKPGAKEPEVFRYTSPKVAIAVAK